MSSPVWNKPKKRAALWSAQEGRCRYCARPCEYMGDQKASTLFTIDHVLPRSLGGTGRRANLVGACLKCNTERQDKPIFVFVMERRRIKHHPRRVLPACLALLDHCRGIR